MHGRNLILVPLIALFSFTGCSNKSGKNGDHSSQASTQASEAKGQYFSAKIENESTAEFVVAKLTEWVACPEDHPLQ